MRADKSFSDILNAAAKGWCLRKCDESVLSLATPIQNVDPLKTLPIIAENLTFQFLWDSSPGLSFAASGQCLQLDLAGARRFELAQRFNDVTLGRLTDTNPEAPNQARPKILLAFSFFEHTAERQRKSKIPPSVQAVLPRWQLSRQGNNCWLRLNGLMAHEADARELAEQLWLMSEKISQPLNTSNPDWISTFTKSLEPQHWQECYKPALNKGLELVNSGELSKLVLAVRQTIHLSEHLNPLTVLSRLRNVQKGSCRFLWQDSPGEIFFGASPETLLKIHQNKLRSDALAGTANCNYSGQDLLQSEKDRREHQLVVSSITKQLAQAGIKAKHPRNPQLAKHGSLFHLHTPITADIKGYLPLHIADALHPTPAVAGLPRRNAITWLRTLEPFERGKYAAPIGWIDTDGEIELRVAIRCGTIHGKILELTAGAGLVKGSIAEKELHEVELKLAVLADQLNLKINSQTNSASKRSIT